MLNIIRENLLFFIGILFYILLGAILLFTTNQGDAIFFFSENRSPIGDTFFKYFTKMGEEPLYIVILISLLFVRFRYALLVPVIGVLVTIVSFLTKSFFAHDRPKMYFEKQGLFDQLNTIEGVELYYGTTSFPSGHTISAFALYGLLALILGKKKLWGPLFFLTAFLVAVSRIYLIQHFVKDVYLGAIIGVLIALTVYAIQSKFAYNPNHFMDKSLLNFNKKPQA